MYVYVYVCVFPYLILLVGGSVRFLRNCGRAAALWFMFWLEMAEGNADKIPREVTLQINDINCFLYKSVYDIAVILMVHIHSCPNPII